MTNGPPARERTEGTPRVPPWAWPALACAISTIPVLGGLSNARIFCFRDLIGFFWPFHVWMRETVAAGHLPLWDPYSGCGYPVIADPTTQVLFLPTIPLRLLLPAALGFNLAVGLALPVAALGAYRLFRVQASAPSAALGALVFSLSGSVVTAVNMPNLAWSVALIPWVLWSTERATTSRSWRSMGLLSLCFGVQALAGEPVTLAATAVVAVLLGIFVTPSEAAHPRDRFMSAAIVAVAGVLGLALSAVELLPLLDVISRSVRDQTAMRYERALHPIAMLEMFAPGVFGTPLVPIKDYLSSFQYLAEGQLPLFLSIYVGLPAVSLALVGCSVRLRARSTIFWIALTVVSLVCAAGSHAYVYAFLKDHLPLLGSFRFPAKYVVFVPLALGGLASTGFDAMRMAEATKRAWPSIATLVVAATALVIALWAGAVPSSATALAQIAAAWHVSNAAVEGPRLASSIAATCARVGLVTMLAGALLWLASFREIDWPRPLLFVLVTLDLLAATTGLNPTLATELAGRPEWAAHISNPASSRVFITSGPDLSFQPSLSSSAQLDIPGGVSPGAVNALYAATFPATPCGIGIRTPLYPGIPALRFKEYDRIGQYYATSSAAQRLLVHERASVATFVTPAPPSPDAQLTERVDELRGLLSVYQTSHAAPRVEVLEAYRVAGSLDDEISLTFGSLSSTEVILPSEPPPAMGDGAASGARSATITRDEPNATTIEASVPAGGGFVLLRDTYDPNWRATVDGQSAELLRANVIFRAVRVAPGAHTIAFEYISRPLRFGAAISAGALLVVTALLIFGRRRSPLGPSDGTSKPSERGP